MSKKPVEKKVPENHWPVHGHAIFAAMCDPRGATLMAKNSIGTDPNHVWQLSTHLVLLDIVLLHTIIIDDDDTRSTSIDEQGASTAGSICTRLNRTHIPRYRTKQAAQIRIDTTDKMPVPFEAVLHMSTFVPPLTVYTPNTLALPSRQKNPSGAHPELSPKSHCNLTRTNPPSSHHRHGGRHVRRGRYGLQRRPSPRRGR